jgi:peptidoglycan/xylan/chitin deacetylase (PgdA/CDA1 family)
MVFMYHNIASGEQRIDFAERQPAYDVSAEKFVGHLKLFRAHGALRERLHLTFDDGYESLYRCVQPLLQNERIRCTCFVTTSALGAAGMLRREEIVVLAKSGFEFGAHSHSHKFLARLTDEEMRQEVLAPQKILADVLGKEVTALSLPGGRYDETLLEYAHACGYREIFTSIPGNRAHAPARFPGLRLWPRWVITNATTDHEIENILAGRAWHLAKSLARHRLGKMSKRVLGNAAYHALWQNFHDLKNSFRKGRATS